MKTGHLISGSIILTVILLLFQNCKPKPEFVYRKVRGGPEKVIPDNRTPLKKLIRKLDDPWKWAETGAGYWIGYTDDMFSIANYKDKALKPLIRYINNTDSLKSKLGALYTIHLIGINSKVAGRQYEEFKDTLARNAILSFIDDPLLHRDVIRLLRRDPWPSDIPFLIDYLSKPDRDYQFVIDALRRYQLFFYFLPVWTPLPDTLLKKELDIYYGNDQSDSQICKIIALKNLLGNRIVIDSDILNSEKWIEGLECYKNKINQYLFKSVDENNQLIGSSKPTVGDLEDFFFHPFADYSDMNEEKIIYAFKNDTLFIYSQEGARKRISDFWNSLTEEEIRQITHKKN